MRLRARVDDNQKRIVEALRSVGASVQHLHTIGRGCPDILCGYRGRNLLLEIKDSDKPKSARQLTIDEQNWHDTWRGQVVVVENEDQALKAIGL